MMKCIFKIAVSFILLMPSFASCETYKDYVQDETVQEEVPGTGEGETPEVPVEPVDPDVILSSVLTFAYYDIEGVVNAEERRIDFKMELYGTDEPNLRYLPITFVLKDGYSIQGTEKDYIRLILSPDEPAPVSFVKGDSLIEYKVYLDLEKKEALRTDFEFKSGVNLSYWFQEDIPWSEDDTLEEISYYGFDHVRLPFDTKTIFDLNGDIRREYMDMLLSVVDKCLELGLNVILDMHWLRAGNLFYDEDSANELVNNWTKLMKEFSEYPNERVAYEILNEPHGYGWEQMQRNMLHLIRHSEPERVVFLSPQGYNAAAASTFVLHGGDPNLVVTFHYYEPMLASHKKLWGYTGPSHYPGLLFSDEEWEAMTDAEKEQAEWHRNHVYDYEYTNSKFKAVALNDSLKGVRIHCGEFGYSKTNIREERIQWFRDIVRAFEANGIAYTVWESWGGDFGPGNWANEPDEEVIDILLQRE